MTSRWGFSPQRTYLTSAGSRRTLVKSPEGHSKGPGLQYGTDSALAVRALAVERLSSIAGVAMGEEVLKLLGD